MRPWFRLVVAVSLGVCIALLLLVVTNRGDQSSSEPATFSSQVGPPILLLDADHFHDDEITSYAVNAGQFVLGTASGNVFVAPLSSPPEMLNVPDQPVATLPGRVNDVSVHPFGGIYAALSPVEDTVTLATSDGTYFQGPLGSMSNVIEFSSDGTRFAVAGFDVFVFNVFSGEGPITYTSDFPPPPGGGWPYEDVVFSSDGSLIAASPTGIDVWENGSEKTDGEARTCDCSSSNVNLTDNGKLAAFGTSDGHLVVVEVESGEVLVNKTISTRPLDGVTASVNGSGNLVVGISLHGEILLWDMQANAVAWRGELPLKSSFRVQFAANDEALVIHAEKDDSTSGIWWVPIHPQ